MESESYVAKLWRMVALSFFNNRARMHAIIQHCKYIELHGAANFYFSDWYITGAHSCKATDTGLTRIFVSMSFSYSASCDIC